MRLDSTDASWRIRLGQRARQLVLGVIGEEEKPDGDLLDRAICEIDQALARETSRADTLAAVMEDLRADFMAQTERLEGHLSHNAMMMGMVYRQLFVCRQVIALIDVPQDDAGQVIAKTLEVMQLADDAWRCLVPEQERTFPTFDYTREVEALQRMEAAHQAKAAKGKTPSKDEERIL
jgi:hypothetical protein